MIIIVDDDDDDDEIVIGWYFYCRLDIGITLSSDFTFIERIFGKFYLSEAEKCFQIFEIYTMKGTIVLNMKISNDRNKK